MAVDVMPFAYRTSMRFFADSEVLTPIVWYRVPRGTPFVPHPTVFHSYYHGDGPRWGTPGYCRGTVLQGEDMGTPRPFYNGAPPPGMPPGTNFCGTAEQWAGDLTMERDGTVAVDEFGVPACCHPTPPVVPDRPILWLIGSEAPTPLTNGVIWSGHGGAGAAVVSQAGFVGPVRITEGATTFVRVQQAFDSQPPPGAWHRGIFGIQLLTAPVEYTIHLVGRPGSTGPVVGLVALNVWPLRVDALGIRWRQGGQERIAGMEMRPGWQLWSISKGLGRLKFYWQGLLILDITDPVPQAGLNPAGLDMNAGLTGDASADIAEVIAWQQMRTVAQWKADMAYFTDRYGLIFP